MGAATRCVGCGRPLGTLPLTTNGAVGPLRPEPDWPFGPGDCMVCYPELMTVAAVADIFRVAEQTVYRMIRRGELDGCRVGRSFRVYKSSVRAVLATSYDEEST